MCNLVIKLQVSYQFSRRRSQWPQQEQQQGSLQDQPPQQHQQPPTPPVVGANPAVQHQLADQLTSDHPGDSASLSQELLSESTGQQHSAGEWRHHAYSLAPTLPHQERLAPNWQRWQHHSDGAAELTHQERCSLGRLSADSASTWHEGHKPAQLQASMRPSSLWGFAASGVDLRQHTATSSEQAPPSGIALPAPVTVAHVGSSPDSIGPGAPDSPSHAVSQSQLAASSTSGFGREEDTSSRGESQQLGPRQATEEKQDQWTLVEHGRGRGQQGRWAPAMLVRHMRTRARRNRTESRPHSGRT